MKIRSYEERDAAGLVCLFHETVHAVNRADYSPEQLRAWSPGIPDPEIWHERMSGRCTLVAEEAGEVIAFAELEESGHLDMLYCRRDYIGLGVGSRLYAEVEREARDRGLDTEASITARPFFERRGFTVLEERMITRSEVELTNFVMEKRLKAGGE